MWSGRVLRKRIILKLFNTFNLYGIHTRVVSSSYYDYNKITIVVVMLFELHYKYTQKESNLHEFNVEVLV